MCKTDHTQIMEDELLETTIDDLLKKAKRQGFTDIHITVGTVPRGRKLSKLVEIEGIGRLMPEDTKELINQCAEPRHREVLEENGEVDFSFSKEGLGRYRANAFKQRGSYAMVVRIQPYKIPPYDELGLPEIIKGFTKFNSGLVLVTGVTGSGKSTTLASLIDTINAEHSKHIVTIEDPIEYLHRHKKSIINQREIGLDSKSFASALRASLREDPDVILVGEMRDLETTAIAITAAETGHLVFSTMHTISAAQSIDRIIDMFPHEQQNQIRSQLAGVLKGVVTQQLVPKIDQSGVVPVCEVLKNNHAIANLIRENKVYQIKNFMHTSASEGMITMNQELMALYKRNIISRHTMMEKSNDRQELQNTLNRMMVEVEI